MSQSSSTVGSITRGLPIKFLVQLDSSDVSDMIVTLEAWPSDSELRQALSTHGAPEQEAASKALFIAAQISEVASSWIPFDCAKPGGKYVRGVGNSYICKLTSQTSKGFPKTSPPRAIAAIPRTLPSRPPEVHRRLYITELLINDLRRISGYKQHLKFSKAATSFFIAGDAGAGKSSVLQALLMLCIGNQVCRTENDGWNSGGFIAPSLMDLGCSTSDQLPSLPSPGGRVGIRFLSLEESFFLSFDFAVRDLERFKIVVSKDYGGRVVSPSPLPVDLIPVYISAEWHPDRSNMPIMPNSSASLLAGRLRAGFALSLTELVSCLHLSNQPALECVTEALKIFFPDFASFVVKISTESTASVSIRTTDERDDIPVRSEGTAFNKVAYLFCQLAVLDAGSASEHRVFMFLLDEPDNGLTPRQAEMLLPALANMMHTLPSGSGDTAPKRQSFTVAASHSPAVLTYFLNDNHASIILCDHGGLSVAPSTATEAQASAKIALQMSNPVLDTLTQLEYDFSSNVMIVVESNDDRVLLNAMISGLSTPRVRIILNNGRPTLKQLISIKSNHPNSRIVAVCDRDYHDDSTLSFDIVEASREGIFLFFWSVTEPENFLLFDPLVTVLKDSAAFIDECLQSSLWLACAAQIGKTTMEDLRAFANKKGIDRFSQSDAALFSNIATLPMADLDIRRRLIDAKDIIQRVKSMSQARFSSGEFATATLYLEMATNPTPLLKSDIERLKSLIFPVPPPPDAHQLSASFTSHHSGPDQPVYVPHI